jgi:hypothetical protein
MVAIVLLACPWDPITTRGAFAAASEGPGVQVLVDQLLQHPEEDAN